MKCVLFVKHCYATALYTTEAQALSVTHARIGLPHACNHKCSYLHHTVVSTWKECGKPISRIKMADYHALVNMGML